MDTIRDVNGPGIKLTGFTYSKIFNENNNETMKLTLGTRFFMAPEMVRNPGHIEHDMKVDTWAVGVVAFFILTAGDVIAGIELTAHTILKVVAVIAKRRSQQFDSFFFSFYGKPRKIA